MGRPKRPYPIGKFRLRSSRNVEGGQAYSIEFFAVHALNNGMSMSVVSRLLGHSSTDITERVYAHYMPDTLASEVDKLQGKMGTFKI